MSSMIDQIRASKLPSNMMQFAARGALAVPPAENIEILVYLARHNRVFGDLAKMTLAGWDEKASLAAAADPTTSLEVLEYMLSPDNLRPKLLPSLLENPTVPEGELKKFAISASRESIETMLQSSRVRSATDVLAALRSNPYLTKEKAEEVAKLLHSSSPEPTAADSVAEPDHQEIAPSELPADQAPVTQVPANQVPADPLAEIPGGGIDNLHDETVSTYLVEHAAEIAVDENKPFQAVGGIVDLLGADYFPVSQVLDMPEPAAIAPQTAEQPKAAVAVAKKAPPVGAVKRENSLQKINRLDVKGRINLALKGNKEERSLLIRDGTKVVALAVLEAPKLSDGEVEKFASQKNVLESVLRQIPLKRRFMKNYIVVRNLVANPRTPLDLGLGLMKNLLLQDLKHLSANKDISDTIRKLALKMYKQKLDAANKK